MKNALPFAVFFLTACTTTQDRLTFVPVSAMNEKNTIVCQVFDIGTSNANTRKTYKAEDFKIHITKNPTFNTPQVSLGWWGRLDMMGLMHVVGKYGIGNSFDHVLLKDEANNAILVNYTNSDVVTFTTSMLTGEPIKFSANCPRS